MIASIIAFNTPIQSKIQGIALQNQISLHPHSVIYTLVDQIKESMSALLEPEVISTVEGEANVLQLFNITIKKKVETIAGCRILSGKVMRSNAIRVVRNGEMIYEGKIKTFKHHKKDIMEASKGLECGISIENFDDIKEGDVIQSILIVTKNRKIE
jgi:translation initiation factor IF-2